MKPVTVVTNGVASDAEPDDGVAVPLAQETLTETDAPLFGTKSLFTWKVFVFRLLVIVQEWLPPTEIATPAHGAWLAAYPTGTVSVAVQVAPAVKPVTVVVNGVASEAEPEAGEGEPLVQVTLTDTEAALFGMKSLLTVSVALLRVLVMVQEAEPPTVIETLAQLAWPAV